MQIRLDENEVPLHNIEMNDRVKRTATHSRFVFGSDPEFHLVRRDTLDFISPGSWYQTSGEIGIDGAGTALELRPGIFDSPKEHLDKIAALIGEASRETDCYLTVDGSYHPLGFHIHLGSSSRGYSYPLENLKALQYELDQRVLPYMRILNGKARSCYIDGGMRTKTYGLEYRSLPAGVLADYDMALDVLTCTYLLAAGYDANLKPKTIQTAEHFANEIAKSRKVEALTGIVIMSLGLIKLRRSEYWGPNFIQIAKEFEAPFSLTLSGRAEEHGLVTNCAWLADEMRWQRDPDMHRNVYPVRGSTISIPNSVRRRDDPDEITKVLAAIVRRMQ